MSISEITISQTGKGPFAAAKSARGLDLYSVGSNAINFTATAYAGIYTYEWTLLERPPGSTAIINNSTAQISNIQADVYGRYVVALRINGQGNNTLGYSKIVAGCSFPSLGTWSGMNLGDWDIPAYLEGDLANWTDFYSSTNEKGGQQELYRILYQLRSYYIPTFSQGSFVTGLYDFSVDTGAIGDYTLGTLPIYGVITKAWYEILSPFTSGGSATVAFGVATDDATGLKTATAYNHADYNAGFHDFTPDGTAVNFTTKTTASRSVIMTIGGATLTAGKVRVFCEYIVSST